MVGWAVSLALRGAGLAIGPADAPAPVSPPRRAPSAEAGPPVGGPWEVADPEPATPAPHPDEPPGLADQLEPTLRLLPDREVPASRPRDRRAGTDLPGPRGEQTGWEAEPAARSRPTDVGPPEPGADPSTPSRVPLPSSVPFPSPIPAGPLFRHPARPEGDAVRQPDAASPPDTPAAAAQPPADRASLQAISPVPASVDAPAHPPVRHVRAARDEGTSEPPSSAARPASRGPNPATPEGWADQPPGMAAEAPAYLALPPVAPPADARAPSPRAMPGPPQPVIPGGADPAVTPILTQGEHRDREPSAARPGRRSGPAGSLVRAQMTAQAAMTRGRAPAVAAQPPASVPEPPARGDGGAPTTARSTASPVASEPLPPAAAEPSGSRAAPGVPTPVQVRIGTVEVHAAPPTPPALAGRPPGFEEYRSMRNYAGWRLDGGRDA